MKWSLGEEGEVVSPLGLIRCFEGEASVLFRLEVDVDNRVSLNSFARRMPRCVSLTRYHELSSHENSVDVR